MVKVTLSLLDEFLVAFYVHVFFCDLAWSSMAFNGRCMVFYDLLSQNIELDGLLLSFLAVIDPNSFGLVSYIKMSNILS